MKNQNCYTYPRGNYFGTQQDCTCWANGQGNAVRQAGSVTYMPHSQFLTEECTFCTNGQPYQPIGTATCVTMMGGNQQQAECFDNCNAYSANNFIGGQNQPRWLPPGIGVGAQNCVCCGIISSCPLEQSILEILINRRTI